MPTEVSLRHAFASVVADRDSTGIIKPSHWNAQHVITVGEDRLVGRDSTGQGVAEEISLASGQLQFDGNNVLQLADTAVTAGTYSYPIITVDAKGRITAAASTPAVAGANAAAEYVVGAATASLPNARIFEDTASVSWDLTTPGKVKANTSAATFEVEDDTSPTLGGSLDGGGFDITNVDDATFDTLTVTDDAYGAGWNGSAVVPTKNAVYDKIELILGTTLPAAYQPLDADLTTWAGLTPSANFQTLIPHTFAQMRADLDLEAGTDFYSIAAADAAFQPKDADLTSWAGVTRASGFDTFAATPSLANLGSLLTDEASGLITFMTTPSSANLKTLITDETGSGGALVFATGPTLSAPILGTPASGTLTSCAGLPPAGVTFANTDRLLGRISASGGVGEEVTCTDFAQSVLDDADAATALATLTASGQGKRMIWIPATAMYARTTNGAATGSTEMATNKNMFKTLDFDTTTQEFAQFEIFFPKSWNLSTVTFQPVLSHASGSGNVVFGLAGVARSNDDAGDVAFGTAQTSDTTVGTANDIYIGAESSAITIAGTPAAGDTVQFQVNRTVASDNLGVDARLHGIRLHFTTNAVTDA